MMANVRNVFGQILLFLCLENVFAEPLSPVEFKDPLDVYVTMLVESVSDPDPATMDFQLEIVLQLYWNVQAELCKRHLNASYLKRFQLDPPKVNDYVQFQSDKIKYFWIPDIYYIEAKEVVLPSRINPPRSLLIYNMGKDEDCPFVYKSKEIITVSCNLNFQMYPLDVNTCDLNIRSFSYPANRLKLHWQDSRGVLINPELRTRENRLQISFSGAFKEWYNTRSKSKFDGIRMSFKFSRSITSQLITTYIPSVLLVFVGFSCFCMSVEAGGERITLTITTLLAVYTQITQVRLSIPPTSYFTNIDIWLFATLGFNLMSTVECALIQGIQFREQRKAENAQRERLAEDEYEEELTAFRRKHHSQLPSDQSEESEWRDEPLGSDLGRMYEAIRNDNDLDPRQNNQSFTEYCDGIGRNSLIGSFVVFFFAYTIYMVIVYTTSG